MPSFELPLTLNLIFPDVLDVSRTEMRRFAAGLVINPESEMMRDELAPAVAMTVLAMTVVPSQSLAIIDAAPAVSSTVTVPLTYHVPEVPCAMLGPSK